MYEHVAGRDLKHSYEWLGFAAGLPAKAVPFTAVADPVQLFSGPCILMGASWHNVSTFGGLITIHDGRDATGIPVLTAGFGGGATIAQVLPASGVMCEMGVYLNVVSGTTVTGCAWVVPLWHYTSTPPGE